MCMHLCREHSGQETQAAGPDGWGHSLTLSRGGLCQGLARAILSPEGDGPAPGITAVRPWPLPVQAFPPQGQAGQPGFRQALGRL